MTDDLARRQRRALLVMLAITMLFVTIAFTAATKQLLTNGWAAFVDRPPGVGASESAPADDAPDTTTPASASTQTASPPAAVRPRRRPRPRPRRPSVSPAG